MNVAALVPLIIPIMRKVVGNSGHKQLVDMLDRNSGTLMSLIGAFSDKDISSFLGNNQDGIASLISLLGSSQSGNVVQGLNLANNSDLLTSLINKIPNGKDSDMLLGMQADLAEIKGMLEMLLEIKDKK